MLPPRLQRLPIGELPGGLYVAEARSPRARLLGLALLDELPSNVALLLPRCSSVHTFGMRFALDIVFLDRLGRVLRFEAEVAPRRIVSCPGAVAVVEANAGAGGWFVAGGLDPGVRRESRPAARAERRAPRARGPRSR